MATNDPIPVEINIDKELFEKLSIAYDNEILRLKSKFNDLRAEIFNIKKLSKSEIYDDNFLCKKFVAKKCNEILEKNSYENLKK